jgi:hypothetical protein
MANHCLEVICEGCGKMYCLRGCGLNSQPNEEYLKEWIKKNPESQRVESETDKGDCCKGKRVFYI